MRFFSRYRPAVYIVDHRRYDVLANGDKRLQPGGFTAEFTNVPGGSMFDTEDIEDPELRDRVEQHLLGHQDYEHRLWLADSDLAQPAEAGGSCMVMIPVAGGVRLCGRATETGNICAEHKAAIESTPEPAPLPDPPAAAGLYDQEAERLEEAVN